MAAKICNICNTRRVYTGTGNGVDPAPRLSDMCNLCYTEGGWENTHEDEGHGRDGEPADPHCWICHPNLNLATRPARTGHTNTVAKTRTSHAGHNHLVTPYDRGLCRKSMAAGHGPYDADAPKV
jgi:hypothetical protein